MENKKILIFTNHFLPGNRAGGPVTSIANLTKLLNDKFEIIIVTSNKDLGVEIPYENVEYNTKVKYQDFNVVYLSEINAHTVSEAIKANSPDFIYLNSFFSTFTQLVLWLTVKEGLKTPIVLAPRGEMQKNALAIKKVKKNIYLTIYKLLKLYNKVYFHATDITESDRIQEMFPTQNISILPNVPKVANNTSLSKSKNELRLIFISRIRDNKNLHTALKVLSASKSNIVFDIYGPLEDEEYWEKCQIQIQALPKNISVAYKGVVSPENITTIMQQYHALLLPTKTENFGHIIVEAMQAGLPPIISDQTPWLNLEENRAGWSLDLGNEEAFLEAVETLYAMDREAYTNLSQSTIDFIAKKLNVEELKTKYIQFLNLILKQKENFFYSDEIFYKKIVK